MSDRFRAFIALALPDDVRAELVNLQAALSPLGESLNLPARWTAPEHLHVTMKFLGYVPRSARDAFSEVVAAAARAHGPIAATVLSPSVFGSPRRARILHAPVDEPAGRLERLAAELEDAAHALGVERETRSFKPHVTLARLKVPSNVTELLAAAARSPLPVRFESLRLYESVPGRAGSRYSVLLDRALSGC